MYVIYALVDPRDYTVHYVGQTGDVYARFKQHINGDGGTFDKKAWIYELRAANRMVIMETLEEVETPQEALAREAYWIRHFQMLKEPLTNALSATVETPKDQQIAARHAISRVCGAMEAAKMRITKEVYTPEQEMLIIQVADQLQAEGVKVTREAIKGKLKWNNAKHPALKAVCDKHKIAVR